MRATIIAFLCLLLAGCMFNSNYKEPNMPGPEVVKAQITTVLDSMHSAFTNRKFSKMMTYLSEDGYYLGSDPTELWTKKQLSDYFSQHVKDTTSSMPVYNIERRDILLDESRNSAVVVEQYYLVKMSDKIMVRAISRLSKKDGQWLINFYSWNMIPRNEDLDKLNDALKK